MADGGTGGRANDGPKRHIPVLLPAMLRALSPRDRETYIDCTFGAGGYSSAILQAANCQVIALDRDPHALISGDELVIKFAARLKLIEGKFSEMEGLIPSEFCKNIGGIVLDIGVSSMQIDDAGRGFSFQADGPLDMRMSGIGPSAADVIAKVSESDLADILYRLGEERRSRAIARAIVKARKQMSITTTMELSEIVAGVLGRRPGNKRHPATRTFQALRIFINRELEELADGLAAAERLLPDGGRLVVVTFHSLEDRIVKRFLALRSGRIPKPSRHIPYSSADSPKSFQVINLKSVKPSYDEVDANPRARSAVLRWAVRTQASAHSLNYEELGIPQLRIGSVEAIDWGG